MVKIILSLLVGVIVGIPIATRGIPALQEDGRALHKCATEVRK